MTHHWDSFPETKEKEQEIKKKNYEGKKKSIKKLENGNLKWVFEVFLKKKPEVVWKQILKQKKRWKFPQVIKLFVF